MFARACSLMAILAVLGGPAVAQNATGVKTLSPAGAIKPTGTWGLATRAGDFLFVAGMRGIDPASNDLADGDEARVRQAFLNMQLIAESEGASLQNAVRLVVYVTDMFRFRPIVNKVQADLWGQGPYPPRTIVEVQRLNQDDIVEVEGTFYARRSKCPEPRASHRESSRACTRLPTSASPPVP
jgi:2-iminobutanoate/2-iminopropanoate deaminase